MEDSGQAGGARGIQTVDTGGSIDQANRDAQGTSVEMESFTIIGEWPASKGALPCKPRKKPIIFAR
jgi:hypothetical protein